jgi:AbrB family looped-hinge helix DNA binding protein
MKKYNKPIKCDDRGQLVIPREIRMDLGLDEGSGFFMYVLTREGILLKKIDAKPLAEHRAILSEIEAKADKLDIKKENLKKSIKQYDKVKEGNLELI